MSKIILLDAGPLGLVTNPRATPENTKCSIWMQTRLGEGTRVLIPAIADYEVRRELLRAGKTAGIDRLNALWNQAGYDPVTPDVLLQASSFWAQVRNMGRRTAPDASLDGDVILAAHAVLLSRRGHQTVVATTNVKHLELFVEARLWRDI
jgi:hypothetical protein